MEGFYVIFDRAEKRVGFAVSRCAGECWRHYYWVLDAPGQVLFVYPSYIPQYVSYYNPGSSLQ